MKRDLRWHDARRVLAVRLDNLGDVLLATPAIHAIAESLPGVEITLLTSAAGAQAGRLNPDITDVLVHEAPWVDPWRTVPHDPAREERLIATLRARRFDAAVIFTSFRQSPLPAAYACYLAGIPLRLGASVDTPGSLLTTRHRRPDHGMHEVEHGLDLVAQVGFRTESTDLVLKVPDAARRRVQGLEPWPESPATWIEFARERDSLKKKGTVLLHPGCSMPARTYPADQYVEVVERLVADLGTWVILTGAGAEHDLLATMYGQLSPAAQEATAILHGDGAFPEFCALIERADAVITNNTGPMHIAAALKTPVVALFALTNPPEEWRPWHVPHRLLCHDVPCRLCYQKVCPYTHDCLRLVTPEMVVTAAAELLGEPETDSPPEPTLAHAGAAIAMTADGSLT